MGMKRRTFGKQAQHLACVISLLALFTTGCAEAPEVLSGSAANGTTSGGKNDSGWFESIATK